MPDILKLKTRRRRLKGEVTRLCIFAPCDFVDGVDAFRKEFKELTKKSITRAFIFREGAKMLIRSLRVQMTKARAGVLHAKARK